jgi:hypothetical protein
VETVMRMKFKEILWILVKKRPVEIPIYSIEVRVDIDLMTIFLIPKNFHDLTFLYTQIVATTNMEGVTKQVKVKHEISNAQ